jgi:hypothetical protein
MRIRTVINAAMAAVVGLTAAAGAQDWPPKLVASFPAPPDAIALACHYDPLYALVGGTEPTVFTLNPWDGSVTGSFRLAVPNGARGIAAAGAYPVEIWVSNRLNRFLYRLDTAGSVLGSFRCPAGTPYGLGGSRYGFAPDRGYLTVSCRNENHVMRVDFTTGSLVSSFPGPASAVIGYDDWMAVDRNSDSLYWNYNGDWAVLDTLPARPRGVTTSIEGTTDQGGMAVTTYVLCRNGYILRYHGSKFDPVDPASLGRVKALFR